MLSDKKPEKFSSKVGRLNYHEINVMTFCDFDLICLITKPLIRLL